MRKYIFVCCIFFLSITTTAQNRFRSGDILVTWQGEYMPLSDSSGENQLWDISDMEVVYKKFKQRFFENGDSSVDANILELCQGMLYDYRQKDYTLFLTGSKTHTSDIVFQKPIVMLKFPLTYRDSVSGFYSGYGDYIGSSYFRQFGHYTYKIDATGSLITPANDTLKNVIRVSQSREIYNMALDADSIISHYGILDSIPLMKEDDIEFMSASAHDALYLLRRLYYTPGYRYPVFETSVLKNSEGRTLFSTAFYCPKESQENLVDDYENEETRWKISRDSTYAKAEMNNNKGENIKDAGIRYLITTKGKRIGIDYEVEDRSIVNFLVCNAGGIVYKSYRYEAEANSPEHVIIDCSNLRNGQYVLYINSNGHVNIEKVTLK